MNSRERELLVKQEGNPNYKKITPSTRSPWSGHKNPRIVRVSRSFGGKDRHSKVCTIRGLRDRRIRLSVPTAVQLYDLQHKLGLSQPSKVVDWLLNATKNDIDKLPPLPIIPGTFTHCHEPNPQNFQGVKISDQRGEIEQDNHEGFAGFVAQLSAQNLFPSSSVNQSSSFTSMPYNNPYFYYDHPNLSLSHFGGACSLPNQEEEQSQNSVFSSTSQLYLPAIIPSFSSYITPSMENVHQNQLSSSMKSKSVHPHRSNDSGRSS